MNYIPLKEKLRRNGYMNYPTPADQHYEPTSCEQLANCLSHLICIIPSAASVWLMLIHAHTQAHYSCAWIYGTSLVLLFTVSAGFHALAWSPRFRSSIIREALHFADHFMIYLFIAASYMPWLTLQNLGRFGEQITFAIWTAATSGVLYTLFFHQKHKHLETCFYICLGVLPAIILCNVSPKSLFEVGVGGGVYVFGVIFFKSDGHIPFAHAIWHVHVAVGAAIHFYAVWTHLYEGY